MNKTIRILKYALPFLALIVLVGIIALRIYALRVQGKAEEVQTQLSRVTPEVTTLEEIRGFVRRMEGAGAGYSGPCDQAECRVVLEANAFDDWRSPLLKSLIPLLEIIGVRPVNYRGEVNVRKGIVRDVNFGVRYRANGNHIIQAKVVLLHHFSPEYLRNRSVLEFSAYAVCGDTWWNEDEGGKSGDTVMVGVATGNTGELVPLRLSCVTSISKCSNAANLLLTKDSYIKTFSRIEERRSCLGPASSWWGSLRREE